MCNHRCIIIVKSAVDLEERNPYCLSLMKLSLLTWSTIFLSIMYLKNLYTLCIICSFVMRNVFTSLSHRTDTFRWFRSTCFFSCKDCNASLITRQTLLHHGWKFSFIPCIHYCTFQLPLILNFTELSLKQIFQSRDTFLVTCGYKA